MGRFLARRLGLLLLTLWLMSVLVFVITSVLPGDVAHTILGQSATPENVAALRHQYGLDYPPPVLYARWITGFITGQWGNSPSYQNTLIAALISNSLFNSLVLAAAALIVIVPISIAFGTLAALRQDRLTDRVISITGLSLMAIPEFVSGIILLS